MDIKESAPKIYRRNVIGLALQDLKSGLARLNNLKGLPSLKNLAPSSTTTTLSNTVARNIESAINNLRLLEQFIEADLALIETNETEPVEIDSL